jgi:Flp pilus assembly pilin Flp
VFAHPPGFRSRCESAGGVSTVLRHIVIFWRSEQAQDLIEYSLLMAFICLSGAAFFIGMGRTTSAIWATVNNRLAASNNQS